MEMIGGNGTSKYQQNCPKFSAHKKKTKTANAANGVWIGTGAGSDAERVCTWGGKSTGATYGIFRVALLRPRRAGS